MGLHGLICGCFAIPKDIGEVQAQVPQDLKDVSACNNASPENLPLEIVNNNSGKQPLPMDEGDSGQPCTGCVAKDSVNSIAIIRTSRSRVEPGVDYYYGMPSGRQTLSDRALVSSRALVGGVEYASFFVNPLAEGSHDGDAPIQYAGATLAMGMGHHNPLAAEYSDGRSTASTSCSSVPGSPAQIKIRALAPAGFHRAVIGSTGGSSDASDGVCCGAGRGDSACPTAPGTPLQRRATVKVIGVVDTACSEHSAPSSLRISIDAAPCSEPEEIEEEEEQEQAVMMVSGLASQPRDDLRRVSGSESGFGSGSEGGSRFGCGAISGSAVGQAWGKEEEGVEEEARVSEEARASAPQPRRSADACGANAPLRGVTPSEMTPSSSPRWDAGTDGGSCGGGGSSCGGGPCDAVRLSLTASLSPPSDLLPQTPVFDAGPIGRRVGSDMTAPLAKQHQSDVQEAGNGGGAADAAAAAAGGGSVHRDDGIPAQDTFAPCTPPLVARDVAAAGAGCDSPQGGREPRSNVQAGERFRSAGGSDGGDGAVAAGDEPPALRGTSSAPSPPRPPPPEAGEERCLAAAFLQVRSVPVEEVAGVAVPSPPLLPGAALTPGAAVSPACEEAQPAVEAAVELVVGEAQKQQQEEEEAMEVEPAEGAVEQAALVGPAPCEAVVGLESGEVASQQASEEMQPQPERQAMPEDPSPSPSPSLGEPSASVSDLLLLRKGFHSGGGFGGRNSTCSSCDVPSLPVRADAPAPPRPFMPTPPAAAPPSRRALATDSISGLTMTRQLIRRLGLFPVTPREPAAAERPAAAAAAVAEPAPAKGECDAAERQSPFAAAVSAATAALQHQPMDEVTAALAPAATPAVAAAPEVSSTAIESGKRSHESVSVTFALQLPNGNGAVAAVPVDVPRAAAAAADAAVEVVDEPRGLPAGDVGAGGGAENEDDEGDEEEDDFSSSLMSTRESSALFEERSSYNLYGTVSTRSMQNWLEPQGWKPLRERYGGGGGQQ
ncbi:hypothetical protein PLESTB_001129200 [Pleodorina starrii]|uniref:Uncharacterized protein n=1 Tax=Pleodorina starrii TaxID=330485 RepID=A0A9W6BRI7_9CHLO|nr:hypothetical protein PLESTM_001366600 [Pleodorina starrii]GLC56635.1 hypothetical protein PLESTB_001129200 [Pleodorina starrii]GLC69023.1 hypothetical protein PLESTF_000771200 [Pleodorina starrii]